MSDDRHKRVKRSQIGGFFDLIKSELQFACQQLELLHRLGADAREELKALVMNAGGGHGWKNEEKMAKNRDGIEAFSNKYSGGSLGVSVSGGISKLKEKGKSKEKRVGALPWLQ